MAIPAAILLMAFAVGRMAWVYCLRFKKACMTARLQGLIEDAEKIPSHIKDRERLLEVLRNYFMQIEGSRNFYDLNNTLLHERTLQSFSRQISFYCDPKFAMNAPTMRLAPVEEASTELVGTGV